MGRLILCQAVINLVTYVQFKFHNSQPYICIQCYTITSIEVTDDIITKLLLLKVIKSNTHDLFTLQVIRFLILMSMSHFIDMLYFEFCMLICYMYICSLCYIP